MKNLTLIILIQIFTFSTKAQSADSTVVFKPINPSLERSFGVCWNIGGATFYTSVAIDNFINEKISLEGGLGFGAPLGIYGGVKYHFTSSKNVSGAPYIGFCAASFLLSGDETILPYVYVPVGYHQVSNKGFDFAIELAWLSLSHDIGRFNTLSHVLGQIKLGHRFLKKREK